MAKESIFRESNLEAANSAEKREDYLKVTSPRLWLVLLGVVILLFGFLIWGFLGRIETYEKAFRVDVTHGHTVFFVNKSHDGMHFQDGAKVTVGGAEGHIVNPPKDSISYKQVCDNLGFTLHDGQENMQVYLLNTDITGLADGSYYDGRVLTETVAPMSFVFN